MDYNEFATILTSNDCFKLGMTFGTFMGLLLFFIITAIVEYAVDLFNAKRKEKKQ